MLLSLFHILACLSGKVTLSIRHSGDRYLEAYTVVSLQASLWSTDLDVGVSPVAQDLQRSFGLSEQFALLLVLDLCFGSGVFMTKLLFGDEV